MSYQEYYTGLQVPYAGRCAAQCCQSAPTWHGGAHVLPQWRGPWGQEWPNGYQGGSPAPFYDGRYYGAPYNNDPDGGGRMGWLPPFLTVMALFVPTITAIAAGVWLLSRRRRVLQPVTAKFMWMALALSIVLIPMLNGSGNVLWPFLFLIIGGATFFMYVCHVIRSLWDDRRRY